MGSAICSSSRFSCRLTADSERPIFRAAAAKLPVSTTASKLQNAPDPASACDLSLAQVTASEELTLRGAIRRRKQPRDRIRQIIVTWRPIDETNVNGRRGAFGRFGSSYRGRLSTLAACSGAGRGDPLNQSGHQAGSWCAYPVCPEANDGSSSSSDFRCRRGHRRQLYLQERGRGRENHQDWRPFSSSRRVSPPSGSTMHPVPNLRRSSPSISPIQRTG